MTKVSSLPKKKLNAIKEEYMQGASLTLLAEKHGVARTSLSYHANTYWKKELELRRAELFEQFSNSKKQNFIQMSDSAIKVMTKALRELAEREYPPTIREAKDATVILESLDKITRLDEGNPTEIVAEKPVSIKDITAKLKLDPFYTEGEIEDADFKEITKSSNDDGSTSSDSDHDA